MRPFTDDERALLFFLANRAADGETLRRQVEVALYDRPWFEGSQSFDIHVPEDSPRYWAGKAAGPGTQIVPGCSVRLDSTRPVSVTNYIGEVFLWVQDGRLDSLEYTWVTDEMPTELPRLDQLVEPYSG